MLEKTKYTHIDDAFNELLPKEISKTEEYLDRYKKGKINHIKESESVPLKDRKEITINKEKIEKIIKEMSSEEKEKGKFDNASTSYYLSKLGLDDKTTFELTTEINNGINHIGK